MVTDSYFCFFRLHLFYLILIPACNTSCSKTPESNISQGSEQIFIDGSRIDKTANVSELIEEINIIPLVQEEGNYIGEIEKVFLSRDHYIIFDRFQSKKIFIYDRN